MVSWEKRLYLESPSILNALCPEEPGHTVKTGATMNTMEDGAFCCIRTSSSTWRERPKCPFSGKDSGTEFQFWMKGIGSDINDLY